MSEDEKIIIRLDDSSGHSQTLMDDSRVDKVYDFSGNENSSYNIQGRKSFEFDRSPDFSSLIADEITDNQMFLGENLDDNQLPKRSTKFSAIQQVSKLLENDNTEELEEIYIYDDSNPLKKNELREKSFEAKLEQSMLEQFEMLSSGDRIMLYNRERGYYKLFTDNELAVAIRRNITIEQDWKLSRRKIDEVIYRLKTQPLIQTYFNDLNADVNLINFRDGVLDLRERRVLPHDPKYCFTGFIDADCKVIPKQKANNRNYSYSSVFERFLTDCTEGDEAKQASLQQMVGYIISNHFNAKKMFVLIGEPHTGKSVWLSLLQILIGKEHTTSMTLKQLGVNRFMQTRLAHSKLNISPEMSDDGDLKGVEFIKAVTGGDLITGDRKGETAIDFYGRTKLVAAGNHMPKLAKHDGTTAFIDRLLFITFNNSIPEEQRDRFLLQKLLEERHIIIKWALEGLYQLIDNNFIFTECDEAIQFKKKYMVEINNVTEFVNDMCVVEPENDKSRVHRTRLYDAYIIYCKANGLTSVKKTEFWREIEKFRVRSGKIRVEGSTPLMGYRGIRLLSPDEYTHT
ncbi:MULTISPECIES: DNA primase family protein [Paenibacillus]|uniref:DNA primase family protein n=1 Tax=Paenibacillus TaxID=44249 RepID=UPI0030CB52C5